MGRMRAGGGVPSPAMSTSADQDRRRIAASDRVLVVIGLVVLAISAALFVNDGGEAVLSLGVLLPLDIVSLWLFTRRRRDPWVFCRSAVATALAGGAAFSFLAETRSFGLVLTLSALAVLPYTAARFLPGRRQIVILGICTLAVLAPLITERDSAMDTLLNWLLLTVPCMVAGWLARAAAVAAGHNIDTELRAQRSAMARELHDGVGHHLSGACLQLQAASATAALRPDRIFDAIVSTRSAATTALDDLRRITAGLEHPSTSESTRQGVALLDELVTAAEEQLRCSVHLDHHGDRRALSSVVDHTVYRVVQEALTNISKHSDGTTRIDVAVGWHAGGIHVVVRNDGSVHKGPPRGRAIVIDGGHGLVGMRERVQLLGGTFSAGPNGQGGWGVDAFLPTMAEDAADPKRPAQRIVLRRIVDAPPTLPSRSARSVANAVWRRRDVILGVAATAVGVWAVWQWLWAGTWTGTFSIGAVFALATGVSILMRRAAPWLYPVVALACGVVTYAGSDAGWFAPISSVGMFDSTADMANIPVLMVGAFAAVRWSRTRRAAVISAVAILAGHVLSWVEGIEPISAAQALFGPTGTSAWQQIVAVVLTSLSFATITALVIAWVVRANAWSRERERRRQRTAEGQQLAAELHEVVGSHLSALSLLATGAFEMRERDPERARAAVDELITTATQALTDLRRLVGILRSTDASASPHPTLLATREHVPA
jgi:signal transduction histidine kinase